MSLAHAVARESARETWFRHPYRFETGDEELPGEVPHKQALFESHTVQVRGMFTRGMELQNLRLRRAREPEC